MHTHTRYHCVCLNLHPLLILIMSVPHHHLYCVLLYEHLHLELTMYKEVVVITFLVCFKRKEWKIKR